LLRCISSGKVSSGEIHERYLEIILHGKPESCHNNLGDMKPVCSIKQNYHSPHRIWKFTHTN